MSTAIIAALPRELRLLTQKWTRLPQGVPGVLAFRNGSTVAVCAGMGSGRVSLAVEAALQFSEVSRLVSFGLAGSCASAVDAGSVHSCETVIDARSGERFTASAISASRPGEAILVSTPNVAGVQEKQRLHAIYNASLVDMEAATVARLAQAHGLLFSAYKGVSDDSSTEIAGIDRFTNRLGGFRETAFAAHVALRPGLWAVAAALGRNSHRALQSLTHRILHDLAQSEARQENR